ncbi:GIY-YIG nuclease family protein [Reyranella sp.]|uniref:GIY-YIG nuclease family protein n=1 Tax=Reyranella sp. TaxID=1929291 RepID=UPI00271A1782|nr:GIY-YIG nuclease family protein [Reyranella sp.]MDO8975418.1 GIY-YIG nuclease family protein [Reyranella sp.]
MSEESGAGVYMVRCADDSYYVGSARLGLERRLSEHNNGICGVYTAKRLPVTPVWSEHFQKITDAIAVERQVKGWPRAKKEALIRGDFGSIQMLAKRRT